MHNIEYYTYPEKVDISQVEKSIQEYVQKETWQEGGHGLKRSIRWCENIILNSYDEAVEYAEKHYSHDYDSFAVKYRDCNLTGDDYSKTYKVLEERATRLRKRYDELRFHIHYKDVKSKFITCRFCESKISVAVLADRVKTHAFWGDKNMCPVCGRDLRPETTLKIIEQARKNAEKAENDLKMEHKKFQEKKAKEAKVRWLLKIEYHT